MTSNRIRQDSLRPFVLRVLIVLGLTALLFLFWQIRFALLLTFGAVVAAVVLVSAASPLEHRLGLPHKAAVFAGGLIILLVLGLFGWFAWPELQAQGGKLLDLIPTSVAEFDRRFGLDLGDEQQGAVSMTGLLGSATSYLTSWSSMVLSTLTSFVLVLFAGVYLAASPAHYRDGVVMLFPPRRHAQVRKALNEAGVALRLWLLGQLFAMVCVGLLITLGLWLIGLPSPLALGVLAGLIQFIPFVGAYIGAVPALLVAMAQDMQTVLWTFGIFVLAQGVESYIITPLAQRRMVEIPPALLILAIAAFGYLFGAAGVIVAAPLTVAIFILVKQLYVHDVLGEEVDIPQPNGAKNASGG